MALSLSILRKNSFLMRRQSEDEKGRRSPGKSKRKWRGKKRRRGRGKNAYQSGSEASYNRNENGGHDIVDKNNYNDKDNNDNNDNNDNVVLLYYAPSLSVICLPLQRNRILNTVLIVLCFAAFIGGLLVTLYQEAMRSDEAAKSKVNATGLGSKNHG